MVLSLLLDRPVSVVLVLVFLDDFLGQCGRTAFDNGGRG